MLWCWCCQEARVIQSGYLSEFYLEGGKNTARLRMYLVKKQVTHSSQEKGCLIIFVVCTVVLYFSRFIIVTE